jgi:transcription elongation factor GreA
MAKKDITEPAKKVLVTKEGLKKLEEELKHLIGVRRKEIADRLAEAISYGDLSENSEYDEAKNEQAFLELRVKELEDQIKFAEIIKESQAVEKGVIQIGSTVKLKHPNGEEHEYTIVGSTESDPMMHKISNESPVGEAVIGKKAKDKVDVVAPNGKFKYEILKVS